MAEDPKDQNLSDDERKRRAAELTQEIANRYDPERLSKMVVEGAGKGEKLDPTTRAKMEGRIGGNFSNVRVFRGAFADAVTKRHGADAVTIARTELILVRETPRSDPRTAQGKALLAHELTHVKQAQRGLHFALDGQGQNTPLEKEAEQKEQMTFADESAAYKDDACTMAESGEAEDYRRQRIMERVFEMLEQDDTFFGDRVGRQ